MGAISPIKVWNNTLSATFSGAVNTASFLVGPALLSVSDIAYLTNATGTGASGGDPQNTHFQFECRKTLVTRGVEESYLMNTSSAPIEVTAYCIRFRRSVPLIAADPVYGNTSAFISAGFSTVYGPQEDAGIVVTAAGSIQIPVSDPTTTLFQCPSITHYAKIFRVKKHIVPAGRIVRDTIRVRNTWVDSGMVGPPTNPAFLFVRGAIYIIYKLCGTMGLDSGNNANVNTHRWSCGLLVKERYDYRVNAVANQITHTQTSVLPTNVGTGSGPTTIPAYQNVYVTGINSSTTNQYTWPQQSL